MNTQYTGCDVSTANRQAPVLAELQEKMPTQNGLGVFRVQIDGKSAVAWANPSIQQYFLTVKREEWTNLVYFGKSAVSLSCGQQIPPRPRERDLGDGCTPGLMIEYWALKVSPKRELGAGLGGSTCPGTMDANAWMDLLKRFAKFRKFAEQLTLRRMRTPPRHHTCSILSGQSRSVPLCRSRPFGRGLRTIYNAP